jgi:ABC-type transport system involved in multi-copper enzyme maturation permease subunit
MKVRNYRMFWAMTILYVVSLSFIFFGLPSIIDYISLQTNSTELKLLKNFAFNFPDIWQNLSFTASIRWFIKILLGFIIITLITNEFTNGTIRSNIINGISRLDFIMGKVSFITLFSFFATLLVFISGMILGLIYSSNTSFGAITGKLIYLAGYFVEIFAYLSFALLLGILIKRTGFAVIILFVYPIIEIIVEQYVPEKMAPYLPVKAMNMILQTPNTSLIQYSTPTSEIRLQTHIAAHDVFIASAYALLFLVLAFLFIRKKDL